MRIHVMMKPLQTIPSLSDQAYQAILDDISDGTLPAGTHLVQDQLAAQLGVSRQPIQQAMALLKADGMIEDVGKRGLRVAHLDLALMRDHYGIRAALDGLAARCAAGAVVDHGQAGELEDRGDAILVAGRKAVSAGSIRDMVRHDEAFHFLIYEASGNLLLPRTAQAHWRFLRRVMGEVLRHAEPPKDIWQQHEDILNAVLSGDAERAERLATGHVARAAVTLTTALDTANSEDGGRARHSTG